MNIRAASAEARLRERPEKNFYIGMSKLAASKMRRELKAAAERTGLTKHLGDHLLWIDRYAQAS